MFTETYIQKNTVIHNLNFWTKLICLSLILPLASFLSPVDCLPFLVLVFAILLILGKIHLSKFWKVSRLYLLSITVGLITLSLVFSSGPMLTRLTEGLILSLRFALLISFGMLFSIVTNPIEIPSGFMQAKIPHKFGVTLMVSYRMMPLLSKKITTVVDAQKARGASFRFSLKKPAKFLYQIVSLIVPLIHSTLEMSVRLSDALVSRGYNPDGKITIRPAKSSFYDLCLFAISIGVLLFSFH